MISSSHELARKLLEMPDLPIEVYDNSTGCWRGIVDLCVETGQGDKWIDINVDIVEPD